MHIAEGVLSAPVLITGAAISAAGIAWGLKKLPTNKLMLAGLLGASFFIASLIHVPVGVSSAHLSLNGLLGVLLGPASFPIIFAAMLLQAVLFQFGGFTVLGVNTATAALGSLCAWYIFKAIYKPESRSSSRLKIAAFSAGFFAILISAILTAASLGLSNEGFFYSAWALFLSHLPIMVIEGFITMFVLIYVNRTNPKFLKDL